MVATMQVRNITGSPTRIHSLVVIGSLPRSLIETVITLAEEPIGVALPPKPAPIAKAQNKGAMSTEGFASPMLMMTGIIAAVNGMLSMTALAMAETQTTATASITGLLPKLSKIQIANDLRYPTLPTAPTNMNRPAKNRSACHSTLSMTSLRNPSLC